MGPLRIEGGSRTVAAPPLKIKTPKTVNGDAADIKQMKIAVVAIRLQHRLVHDKLYVLQAAMPEATFTMFTKSL